jgi:hypothetical protein
MLSSKAGQAKAEKRRAFGAINRASSTTNIRPKAKRREFHIDSNRRGGSVRDQLWINFLIKTRGTFACNFIDSPASAFSRRAAGQ